MVKIYLSNQNLLAGKLTFSLFLEENICCGNSLEVPHRGTSNEYPQHIFFLEIRTIYIYHNLDTLLNWIYEILVPGLVN